MNVRLMRRSDAPALAEIEKMCFSVPWSARSLEEECYNEHACFLVAEDENGILGYAGMMTVLDEGSITNVAVRPDRRRRGVADELVRALKREALSRKIAVINLEVRQGNEAAIALYAKHGFLPVGRRKDFYQCPTEDAVLMACRIGKEGQEREDFSD